MRKYKHDKTEYLIDIIFFDNLENIYFFRYCIVKIIDWYLTVIFKFDWVF